MTEAPPPRLGAPLQEMDLQARRTRWLILSTVAASKAGHIGGPLSATDLLVALYFHRLRVDPQRPEHPLRDRFILSKGHCAIALYAVLALRGYFPLAELATFDHGASRLQGHPDMHLTPGIDFSTGSLGQGLSNALGIALAAKRLGLDFETWTLLGDGECQEGQVWEAVLTAPRFGVDNLVAVVDDNGLQQFGAAGGPEDRFDRAEPLGTVNLPGAFAAFGWNTVEVAGNDLAALLQAFAEVDTFRGSGRPTALISRTTKGHGVGFAAGTYRWHNGVPSEEQLESARAELDLGDWPEGVHDALPA